MQDLGMVPLPIVADEKLAFKDLNKRLALLVGPGKWLRWLKDVGLKNCLVEDVFKRSAGVRAADLFTWCGTCVVTVTTKLVRCVRHLMPTLPPRGHRRPGDVRCYRALHLVQRGHTGAQHVPGGAHAYYYHV